MNHLVYNFLFETGFASRGSREPPFLMTVSAKNLQLEVIISKGVSKYNPYFTRGFLIVDLIGSMGRLHICLPLVDVYGKYRYVNIHMSH